MRVRITEQAFERLAEIEDFVAYDSPAAAVRLTERIVARAESLHSSPERGRVVPEIGQESVREVLEGNYRIVYRVGKEAVEVLTVFERHRRFPKDEVAGTE